MPMIMISLALFIGGFVCDRTLISNLVMWNFFVFIAFTPSPVFTATFTTIRVPLSIAPIIGIPRPDIDDVVVARSPELYNKSTIYDLTSALRNSNIVLESTVSNVISNAFALKERGTLIVDDLTAYNCTRWCVDLPIQEITRVTGKTVENLKGNPDGITVLEMHNAIVKTMEDIHCFNMTVIENSLNMSSQFLLESQWALFATQIVMHSVKCRADFLGVNVSELAELLRTDLTRLFSYTLEEITDIFFPNFLWLQSRKNVFETRSLDQAYEQAGLSPAQGAAKTMLSFADDSSISFSLRDLEILYDWQKPQLFAIGNIPLSSYLSPCFLLSSNSLFSVSSELFGNVTAGPTCNVAYVLSRSLSEVEANFNALTAVEAKNSLYIFMTTTNISSWFRMDDILQLLIEEGVWVEIPSVGQVASAANQTAAFIKTCSLPEVIASLRNSNKTGALTPFREINNPTFRNLLLNTYGYSYNELISLTEAPLEQLSSLPVVNLHAIILEALVDRYSISNLPLVLGIPGVVDMHILSTLPSFEWSRIVRSVVQASFAHVADALSVDLSAGNHIAVIDQADGNPSIHINPSAIYFSPRIINTSTLATCLLGRNEIDINSMQLPEYHRLFSVNTTPIILGKITFERISFENLLAADNLVLWQVWNETVADVVFQYAGLTVGELGCLYGWDELFLELIAVTVWRSVSESVLCSEYEKSTLYKILIELSKKVGEESDICFVTAISLSSINYNVTESDGMVSIIVHYWSIVPDSQEVRLSLSPVTAINGTDFRQSAKTTFTLQGGNPSMGQKEVLVDILNDEIVENDEQFLVSITSSNPVITKIFTSTATVTIVDDDFVSLSWQNLNSSVQENVPLYVAILELNSQTEESIDVSIVATDLTTSPEDYILGTTAVRFSPGDTRKTVQLSITNDEIVEQAEILQLTPSTSDASVKTTNKTIIILNDDSKCFYFDNFYYY